MKETRATTSQGLPLVVQQGPYTDFPESARHYLMSSWVRSYIRFADKSSERLRSRFKGILANKNTSVVMALFPDSAAKSGEERIIGWAVAGDMRILLYVYVRNVYRHGGAGHLLLATAIGTNKTGVLCSHWCKTLSKNGRFSLGDYGPDLTYVGSDIIRT